MPIAPTYPGVYVEEIPSGVRTITGVATSITAFVGRALRGPVNEPVTINSFADFERTFGGLREQYLMSYAVRDFYLNGGSQALVVRLVNPNFATEGQRDAAIRSFKAAFAAAKAVADAATGTDVAAAKQAATQKNSEIQNGANRSPAEKAAAQKVFDAVQAVPATGTLDDVKKAANDNLPEKNIPGKAVLRLPTATAGQNLALEASNE